MPAGTAIIASMARTIHALILGLGELPGSIGTGGMAPLV
jgi:hypothetical protein